MSSLARTSPLAHARPGLTAALGAAALGATALGCGDPCDDVGFDRPPEPSPGPDSPPTVVGGEWLGAGVLELRFSEPLSATEDLDPSRFALIVWDAVASSDYADACYLRTSYRELGSSYFGYGGGLDAVWVGLEDPTRLRLRVRTGAAACPNVNGSVAAGLLLAYTDSPAAAPLLRDADGVPVPDLGPQWAITDLDRCLDPSYTYCGIYSTATGHLPALSSVAAIPCP